jgi:hypothetical protein
MTKSGSKAERSARLAALESLVLDGTSAPTAVAAHATAFGLTLRRAQRDMRLVRAKWRTAGSGSEEKGQALARSERLFALAVASGDTASAIQAERDRCVLLGLAPAGK